MAAKEKKIPKKQSKVSKAEEKKKESNIFHFHTLYQRGLKQMQDKQKVVEEAKKRKVEQEKSTATFRPSINANSRLMVV